ncbi:MAG: carbonic anhydrase [Gammaproteobacteria bacterium CG_4_10_14_0_8_um_filter_38_16]|nr:MAG: carbonic anhydrase [Gammaproteobacteria bacterium CG_4_10_14_0_8_um_filter_38_16]PJA03096.1 MAG: carbonic anhydrase [Gammaproteobacteria bacterium CG_4_10_14_0_2_um_filter_38_22]PJB10284.1 MAG: carbonic anhydrase [Gammaproteobacteria bacterium CG_4_9_14_3_um_filter_38_9]
MRKYIVFLLSCIFLMAISNATYAILPLTPDNVLNKLIKGNTQFVQNHSEKINYLKQAKLSQKSQHPIAMVISCIDARVPSDIIFNQHVGNIFVTRIAANVINKDVLAGLEYATQVVGAKLIVVLGHDDCGAVKGACRNVKLGNLTQLLNKVQPAIQQATQHFGKKECDHEKFINWAAKDNVRHVVAMIPQQSIVIQKLIQSGKVKVIGAMYHLKTGKVTFFN